MAGHVTQYPNCAVCCGEDDCEHCPGGAAAQYKVTISGVTNGFCSNCASINGEHILEHDGDCTWTKQITGLCDGTDVITLQRLASGWHLTITVGVASVSYKEEDSESCLTQEDLDFDNDTFPGLCNNWPATVTVEPE